MKTINQILLLAFLLTGAFFVWHFQDQIPFLAEEKVEKKRKGGGGRAVSVIVASAIKQDLPRIVTAVGTVRARESVDITSKVTAKILKLGFTEGTHVEKGTPLVYLDATEPRAQLSESQAELVNSRKLYERAVKLYKSRNTPKARVDLLLSEMQVAEAKVAAMKARLNDYVIIAPFSGVLGFREVSVGALVRPADVITTLDDITSLKLDFDLPESHLASIKKGQPFQASSVAFQKQIFDGLVRTVSTRIDPVTRAVRIRGEIPNESGELKPGMFLSVILQTGMQLGAILVPEHAVTISAAGHFVYVVKDGIAHRTDIEVGQRSRGWVQVVTGLSADTVVITEGLQKVKDGRKVKISEDKVQSKITQKNES